MSNTVSSTYNENNLKSALENYTSNVGARAMVDISSADNIKKAFGI